ncbi:MAG: protein phosphatase 2C domain-containing protein [Rhizobiaceae bacterium]|jgi:protein phosphatase|nr:protein phosphatase 2C domain-containing protein [Rhizobiaceae bacterium]
MTTPRFQLSCHAVSDVGRVRELNEDRVFSDAEAGLFMVADGMGGHEGGDFASSTIVGAMQALPPITSAAQLSDEFYGRMFRANGGIRRRSQEEGGRVMGSTVVALLVFGGDYLCAWAGDSRAYLLRGEFLTQLTQDHTEVQDLLNRGLLTTAEAANYPRRNVITNAIGVSDYLHLDVSRGHLAHYDTILLCSDGLTTHVSNEEIGEIMAGRRVREICDRLVALANERGGTDNVSVCAIQFHLSKATVPVALTGADGGGERVT